MIMNSQGSSTVTTVGDVQENQISIDQRNIEHIISILSTNLYSHPEQSFLREIVSNAIDAQVEAKSEEPAIISMAYDVSSGKNVIAIRDYGTGISPERFKEIYLNIGSSTKRDSNDYIGSFGIGRFSALACADMVHITSYYNGTQYNYLMLKNGSKINIDLISTEPTEEHNGVEVKIKVNLTWSYINALRSLWFVPNVYVHGEGYDMDSKRKIDTFNLRKICRFKNFAFNNTGEDSYFVLLGNILYPIDSKYIPAEYNGGDNLTHIWYKIIPQFNIGDLDVTPNREQLLYSDKTIKALEEKFRATAEELIEICAEDSKKVFDNIFEYFDVVTSNVLTLKLPHENDDSLYLRLKQDCFLRNYMQYSYKNDPMADDKSIRDFLSNFRYRGADSIFDSSAVFVDGRYLTQKRRSRYCCDVRHLMSPDMDVRIFFLPTMEKIKSDIFKAYLKEKADAIESRGKKAVFILTEDKPSFSSVTRYRSWKTNQLCIRENNTTNWHKTRWIMLELIKALNKHIFIYDIANSPAYLAYRKEVLAYRKEERKNAGLTNFSQTTRFYVEAYPKQSYMWFKRKLDVKNVSDLVKGMKDIAEDMDVKNAPVYWGVVDDPYLDIWKKLIACKQIFCVVTVSKTNLKHLERAALPKNWQKVDAEFILNSRAFRRWITCMNNRVYAREDSMNILHKTSERYLYNDVVELSRFSPSSLDNVQDRAALNHLKSQFSGYYDVSMMDGYATIAKYNEIAQQMQGILRLDDCRVTPLSMYAAMKRKIIRPGWTEYQRITRAFNPKTEETDEENN